jgi:hypothetical protein
VSGGHDESGVRNEWVELLVTYDSLEAEMVREILKSGGIPVVVRSSKVSPYPVNVGKIGEVRVLVRQEDREIAERVMRGERDGESSAFEDADGGEATDSGGGFRQS